MTADLVTTDQNQEERRDKRTFGSSAETDQLVTSAACASKQARSSTCHTNHRG